VRRLVPGKLFVPGDAAATAERILAVESLYRAHVVVGVVSELFFVASVVALYRLLRGVNAERPSESSVPRGAVRSA
jgi:hypothetical protein